MSSGSSKSPSTCAGASGGSGFNIGNSATADHPDHHRRLRPDHPDLEDALRRRRVRQPGDLAGRPPGRELLRTSYMATHTDEQLERVLEIFEVVGKQLGLI